MGGKGRDLDEERLARRVHDELKRDARDHVGQIGRGLTAIVDQSTVFIQRLIKLGIAVARDIPFVPPGGRRVFGRTVTVQIFAEHPSPIAAALQRNCEGAGLIAVGVEPAIGLKVAEHAAVVGKPPVKIEGRDGQQRESVTK